MTADPKSGAYVYFNSAIESDYSQMLIKINHEEAYPEEGFCSVTKNDTMGKVKWLMVITKSMCFDMIGSIVCQKRQQQKMNALINLLKEQQYFLIVDIICSNFQF